MTRADSTLATLLRGAQWRLDEAAFEVDAGRYTSDQCAALANTVVQLAEALRQYTPPQVTEAGGR